MASTPFPNHTVQRHIVPTRSNKSPAAKCLETQIIRKLCNVGMMYSPVSLCTKDVTAHPYMVLFLFFFVQQPYIFLIFQNVFILVIYLDYIIADVVARMM